jgi:hypothetical protein
MNRQAVGSFTPPRMVNLLAAAVHESAPLGQARRLIAGRGA